MDIRTALIGILIAVAPCAAQAAAFDGFGGRWVGTGSIRMSDGKREKLKCIATYFSSAGGTSLAMNVRCASNGFKIDAKGTLSASGDRISGMFEERNYNNRGTVSGTAEDGAIHAVIRGDAWLAAIEVSGHGALVMMTPHAGVVKVVWLVFKKG